MKFSRLSATLAVAVTFLLPTVAIAQEPDYICFMTTPSGQVVDLSDSLCHATKSQPDDGNNQDQAFVEDYKQEAMAEPAMRDNLLANVQQSSEENISKAKSFCNSLKDGYSLQQAQRRLATTNTRTASTVNARIVQDLATKYYCPQSAQR